MPARAQATRHRGPNVWRAMSGMVAKLKLIGLAVGDAWMPDNAIGAQTKSNSAVPFYARATALARCASP
jgi:hypothetical protein